MHKNIHWIFGSKYNPTKSDFTYHHRYNTYTLIHTPISIVSFVSNQHHQPTPPAFCLPQKNIQNE